MSVSCRRSPAICLCSFLLVGSLAGGNAALGCSSGRGDEEQPEASTKRTIEEVQEAHTPAWMEIAGVIGTGIGLCNEEPCIKVFVARRTEEIEEKIPEEVEGYPVRIEVTGEFRALETSGGG